ncbi:MAG: sel1 repeat family protein [Aliidiomarina sp.]|uniref:tetratricopeptide repeat protein n=1 Tax=Aliidiomarina sp. TaxID=1872439 RepID=UPI0025C541B8|nr:tetratricopeptide repeat protein [Aliidiomarina sp.]MCH8502026.1 sel1 repeat family protein [Aliidiomarina sp.]
MNTWNIKIILAFGLSASLLAMTPEQALATEASEQDQHASERLCADGSCRPHIMMLHRQARYADFTSMSILAMIYVTGDGVEQDIDRGIGFMKQAARGGNPMANFTLSTWYRHGKFVEQDTALADRYLQHGVDHQYAPAQYQKALQLYMEETEASTATANQLLEAAASRGSAPAMFLLARLKLNGQLFDYDLEGATRLLRRLSVNGHTEARALSRQLIADLQQQARADEQTRNDELANTDLEIAKQLQEALDIERISVVGTPLFGRTESAIANVTFQRDALFERGSMFRIRSQQCDFGTNCASVRPSGRHSDLFDLLNDPEN